MQKILSILILSFLCNMAFSKDHGEIQIKQLIEDNLKYTSEEHPEKALDIFHSQSPLLLSTKNVLPQIFGSYDLSYEILSYKFVGDDGDLAYVRVKQRTKKIKGPAFRDNVLDMVQIYRQEDGLWKLWTQVNVDINYLN